MQRQDLRLPDGLLRLHSPGQLRLDMRHPDRLLKQRRPGRRRQPLEQRHSDRQDLFPAPVNGLQDLLQEVDIEADLLQEVLIEVGLLPDAMEVARTGAAMTGAGAEAWAAETCPGVAAALAAEACPGVVVEIPISHFSGTIDSPTRCLTGSMILTMITR